MKLYYSPGACSLASHIALAESGESYDLVRVDLKEHRTEDGADFYAISPRGYVPAVETADLGLLTENPAVLSFIAVQTGAMPDGADRYRLLEWIGYVGTEVHAGYHPLFGGAPEGEQAEAKADLAKKYRLVETLMDGSDWLVGDAPTVADNYLFVTLLWARKFGVEVPAALADFRARNLDRPAVRQAMSEEGLG
jgi:glutathione S-transferase